MVHIRLFLLSQCLVSCFGASPDDNPGVVLAQPVVVSDSPSMQLTQAVFSGAPVVQGVRAVMQAVASAQQVAQTQSVATLNPLQSNPQVTQATNQAPMVKPAMLSNMQQTAVAAQQSQLPTPTQVSQVQPGNGNVQQTIAAQAPAVVSVQMLEQPVVVDSKQLTNVVGAGTNPVQVAVTSANTATRAANVAASAAANANAAATNAANAANSGKSTIEANSAQTAAVAAKRAADAANEAAIAANTAAKQAAMANALANPQPTLQQSAASQVAMPVAAATVVPSTPATAPAQAAVPIAAATVVLSTPASAPVQAAVPIAAATVVPSAPVAVTIGQFPETSSSVAQWYFTQCVQLIYGLTFAMIVKGLCVAGNVLVQVSPISQIKRWEARQCTGEADAAPYVSIAFGGWQWCFYGLFAWIVTARSGFLILVQSNCLGALLGSYYVVTFYRNCRNDCSLSTLQRYLSAVTSLALLQVCALSVLPAERALFLTGLISSFCSFIGATSVLVTVPQVIRQKDSRSIPGPYAFANFLSSAVWSLCGYILDDPMVMIPNIFSTCCATMSLGLKLLYPSEGSDDDDANNKVEEGVPCEMQDRKAQLHAKKALKMATEFTPMLPAKPIKEMSTFPAKLAEFSEQLPDTPVCGTVSECGTGGTF